MIDLNDLITVLSKLPGVGRKSATRISYYLLKNKNNAIELSNIVKTAAQNITNCSTCGNFTINNPCYFCTAQDRDDSTLCIVEDPKDLLAIEETGFFRGRYHVLMGSINPLEGITPDKLKINELVDRVDKGSFTEILIATNPTTEGEATFLYLQSRLSKYDVKLSKLATGIPMGGSLEYADKLTLSKAIQSKRYI